ncbi:MAG: hypothetical protein ACYS21_15840, partial [Planctomycetota bacterium]
TTKNILKSPLTAHQHHTQNHLVSYAYLPHRDISELALTTKQSKIPTIEPVMRVSEWAVQDLNL